MHKQEVADFNTLRDLTAAELRQFGNGELTINWADQYDYDFLTNMLLLLYRKRARFEGRQLTLLRATIDSGQAPKWFDRRDLARTTVITDCAEALLSEDELDSHNLRNLRQVLASSERASTQSRRLVTTA